MFTISSNLYNNPSEETGAQKGWVFSPLSRSNEGLLTLNLLLFVICWGNNLG